MPAKGLRRVSEGGSFSHVYNKGVEGRAIFKDSQDYEMFLAFLRDYLTPPLDPETSKTTFTVRGRDFKGTPHQPKNYFEKIELLSYRLSPESFHLLLHQKEAGSLESFIRSLCTRYSLYYNKKHQRQGSLFAGPYKSVHIEDASLLLLLTYFLHHDSEGTRGKSKALSSYPEYAGRRNTSWVKTDTVFSMMAQEDYRKYIQNYKLSREEDERLRDVTLENTPLERRNIDSVSFDTGKDGGFDKPPSRIMEIAGMTAVFFLLLGVGYRNVALTQAGSVASLPDPQPAVLSESDSAEPVDESKPKIVLAIKNVEAGATLPIHVEPSVQSEIVAEAKSDDVFEYVSINSGWFGVKLTDGTGYIHSDFIEVLDTSAQ